MPCDVRGVDYAPGQSIGSQLAEDSMKETHINRAHFIYLYVRQSRELKEEWTRTSIPEE